MLRCFVLYFFSVSFVCKNFTSIAISYIFDIFNLIITKECKSHCVCFWRINWDDELISMRWFNLNDREFNFRFSVKFPHSFNISSYRIGLNLEDMTFTLNFSATSELTVEYFGNLEKLSKWKHNRRRHSTGVRVTSLYFANISW